MTQNDISYEYFEDQYSKGINEYNAILTNGEKFHLRLFNHSVYGMCYYAKGKQRRGYQLSNFLHEILSVKPISPKNTSIYDDYISNLEKFKKAYTRLLHGNLWAYLRNGYSHLNIEEFKSMVEESNCNKDDRYELYKVLCQYCSKNHIDIITENRYKIVSVKSYAPTDYRHHTGFFEYKQFVSNIAKHLENKEDFRYEWRSSYDVHVSGKLLEDGQYQAWFSLEFKDCGNGHYYLLINENQAVFCEDD